MSQTIIVEETREIKITLGWVVVSWISRCKIPLIVVAEAAPAEGVDGGEVKAVKITGVKDQYQPTPRPTLPPMVHLAVVEVNAVVDEAVINMHLAVVELVVAVINTHLAVVEMVVGPSSRTSKWRSVALCLYPKWVGQ